MTGLIFEQYVLECLVPTLCRGDIVIMDNLSAHKRAVIEAAIEARGAQLEYWPPYSSDFNPMEDFQRLAVFYRTNAGRGYAVFQEFY
jgi:transposase